MLNADTNSDLISTDIDARFFFVIKFDGTLFHFSGRLIFRWIEIEMKGVPADRPIKKLNVVVNDDGGKKLTCKKRSNKFE